MAKQDAKPTVAAESKAKSTEASWKTYLVLFQVKHEGKRHKPGKTVRLSDEAAERLLACGAIAERKD